MRTVEVRTRRGVLLYFWALRIELGLAETRVHGVTIVGRIEARRPAKRDGALAGHTSVFRLPGLLAGPPRVLVLELPEPETDVTAGLPESVVAAAAGRGVGSRLPEEVSLDIPEFVARRLEVGSDEVRLYGVRLDIDPNKGFVSLPGVPGAAAKRERIDLQSGLARTEPSSAHERLIAGLSTVVEPFAPHVVLMPHHDIVVGVGLTLEAARRDAQAAVGRKLELAKCRPHPCTVRFASQVRAQGQPETLQLDADGRWAWGDERNPKGRDIT